jgi:cytoskeletal protein RodZ
LPSFGQQLKLEREKRNITLEQISSSTKIGTRMLEALEQDKFNQLPGGIFNKGFVRAYARFVGLDEDQTVADYLQASGDLPPASTEIAPREDRNREARNNERDKGKDRDKAHERTARENPLRHGSNSIRILEATADAAAKQIPWGLFAALLLAVALALTLWSRRAQTHTRQSLRPIPSTNTTLPASPASGAVPNPNASVSKAGENPPPANQAVTSHDTSSPSPLIPKPFQNPLPQDALAAAVAATHDEFQVAIHAREESWISTMADNAPSSSEILAAGSDRTVRGRKEIVVRVGNSGGVDLRFNGKKQDIRGEFGEVKTITFGPLGVLPNSPANTPAH